MYAIMTLRFHYPPDYVLDRMEMYEVRSIFNYSNYAIRDNWEQSRFISYIIASCNSTKKIELTDLLKFPWEESDDTDTPKPISDADIKRLRAKAQNYLKSNNLT